MDTLYWTKRHFLGFCWLLLLGAAGLVQLTGCSASNPYPVGTYERAMHYVENGKNLEAAAALESFVRNNPTDSLAAEAQYQKALLYIESEEYPLAAVEFQILRKDYPTSDRVEDAFFQEGIAYFRQVGKIQRDVTGAHEARLHFLKFSQEYPDSEHMPAVLDHMQQISDLMVRKRLQQAKVFWQLKRFAAIEVTLGKTLKDESGSSLLDQVLWQRGRAAERLYHWDLAAEMYQRLITEYPESSLRDRAQSALRSLDEDLVEEEGDEL